MPEIRPLRALRYNSSTVGDLSLVLCPPYDVLSAEDEARLRSQHPRNFVRVILPHHEPERDRYRAAAELLTLWRRDGTLQRDPVPSYYLYEQEYELPSGETLRRVGLFALVRLHDFSEGVVIPHEHTLPSPREDRYRLLEATSAHLDPVFALYSDPSRRLDPMCSRISGEPPLADTRTGDGVRHRLWLTNQGGDLSCITQVLASSWILIADGHHRYESALRYARSRARSDEAAQPQDFMLMVLCNIDAPGLSVLPIHRLVHSLADFNEERWLHDLDRWFERRTFPLSRESDNAAREIEEVLRPHRDEGGAVVVAADRRRAHLLTLRAGFDRAREMAERAAGPMLDLDVSLVHHVVLERSLGIRPDEQVHQTRLRFAKSTLGALDEIASGGAQAAIFMNPTPLRSVVEATRAGLRMPPKSTFFHPKMISGLIIHPFDDEG